VEGRASVCKGLPYLSRKERKKKAAEETPANPTTKPSRGTPNRKSEGEKRKMDCEAQKEAVLTEEEKRRAAAKSEQ